MHVWSDTKGVNEKKKITFTVESHFAYVSLYILTVLYISLSERLLVQVRDQLNAVGELVQSSQESARPWSKFGVG